MNHKKGFTLVELLIVIGILVILMAITIVAVLGLQGRAKAAKTKGLVGALMSAIQAYESDWGDFPPDGYDPGDQTGGRKGSASLVNLLCNTLVLKRKMGEGSTAYYVNKDVGPYYKIENLEVFTLKRATDKDTIADPTVEFKDGWNRALEYDRVEDNGKITLMNPGHGTHSGKAESNTQHSMDPRVADPNIKDLRKDYFFWSSGPPEKKSNWKPQSPIGNWNITGK